jgi:hypothetical protein
MQERIENCGLLSVDHAETLYREHPVVGRSDAHGDAAALQDGVCMVRHLQCGTTCIRQRGHDGGPNKTIHMCKMGHTFVRGQ